MSLRSAALQIAELSRKRKMRYRNRKSRLLLWGGSCPFACTILQISLILFVFIVPAAGVNVSCEWARANGYVTTETPSSGCNPAFCDYGGSQNVTFGFYGSSECYQDLCEANPDGYYWSITTPCGEPPATITIPTPTPTSTPAPTPPVVINLSQTCTWYAAHGDTVTNSYIGDLACDPWPQLPGYSTTPAYVYSEVCGD